MRQTKTEKELPLFLKFQLYIDSLLEVKKENRNLLEIISWWELKRIPYNLFLISLGWISLNSSHYFLQLEADENVYTSGFFIISIILFNVAYSLSCFSELFTKKSTSYGPSLFKKGFVFCALFYILPAIIHFNSWIYNLS